MLGKVIGTIHDQHDDVCFGKKLSVCRKAGTEKHKITHSIRATQENALPTVLGHAGCSVPQDERNDVQTVIE
jgi:hypothetical protein